MKEACVEAGVAEPVFEITDFLQLYFTETMTRDFGEKFGEFGVNISETQLKIIKLVQMDLKISAKRIAENLNMSTRAIEKCLKDLREKNLIQRASTARGGNWIIDSSVQEKLK